MGGDDFFEYTCTGGSPAKKDFDKNSRFSNEGLSPVLSRKSMSRISDSEKSGTSLNTSWTFWLDNSVPNLSASQYEASLRKIYTVTTIESFWGVINHLPMPSKLKPRYGYHLMRENTRPFWEDKVHASGGMWKLRCQKKDTDSVWQEILLACIGEQFTDHLCKDDEIVGLSVNIRKNDDLVQLWNVKSSQASESKAVNKITQLLPHVEFRNQLLP